MAEITSDVFDIFHPTPVPLRELSAIAISLEIWRCEINKYRSSGSLKNFRPSAQRISSKTMIPDLPSVIYPIIDKYVERFGLSMSNWLWKHHRTVFHFHYHNENSVLKYFEDFVCDYNGTIHFERTSERMMHCDRFDIHQKFLIACTYCFEDDIIRIWPALGLKKTDSLYNRYSEKLLFAYWIDFLENDIRIIDSRIEEWVFNGFMPHSRSSVEYFWNLTSSENHLQRAVDLFISDFPSFVRFILPKLDDQQLNEFLYANGCELLYFLLKKSRYDEEVILSTWFYVKTAMSEITFTNLIVKVMQNEITRGCVSSELDDDDYDLLDNDCFDDRRDLDHFLQLCLEIWNTAAENLKRFAVRDITLNNRLFDDDFSIHSYRIKVFQTRSTELKFLLTVFSHATYEQRNVFLHNCWKDFITEETCWEDLQNILKLCLPDENKITQFKTNFMANHEKVLCFCGEFLSITFFDELNDFVRFLLPDMEAARNFKQKLLSHFIDDRRHKFSEEIIQKSEEFNEFVNDAYNNIDLSTDFKNRLMSSPSILKVLSVKALYVPIEQFIKFIDTFVSTERILREVKTHIINFLKEEAADYKSMVPKSSFTSLLSWCLEGNEEVSKFELSYL